MLSWHEKEENILYSFHHRTKYIYKLRIVLSTQYKYRITLINVNLIIFSTISLTLFCPSSFLFDDYSREFQTFPFATHSQTEMSSFCQMRIWQKLWTTFSSKCSHTETFAWNFKEFAEHSPFSRSFMYLRSCVSHWLFQLYFRDNPAWKVLLSS